MDLVQIRYFLALAESLNFTRAAERCNVTQPALTRSIQRLEDELGGPLLLRERSLTQLTELGRVMLPMLQRTYAAAEEARTKAATLQRQEAGVAPLRLGLCSLVIATALAPVLRALADRFGAAFELTLIRGTSERLTEMLLRGELDAALLPGAELESERLNRWLLFEDKLVVLAPAGHRLAALQAVPVAALQGETVLVDTEEGCALRRALGRLCDGGALPVRHRVSGAESAAQLAAAGLGVALATGRQPTLAGLMRCYLDDPAARQPIMLATVAGRPAGRAVDAFIKLARARHWAEPDAG